MALRETCPNAELFLVRIFSHSGWIRWDTPYLSIFSLNVRKCGPKEASYLGTFHTVWYISREDIKELTDIQFTIIWTILNLPISTPIPALIEQIGEFPIELNIEERNRMYSHKAITSRINDIPHIQIEEYNINYNYIKGNNILIKII